MDTRHEVRGVLTDTTLAPSERDIVCLHAHLRNVDLSERAFWYFGSQTSVFEQCDFRGFVADAGSLASGRGRSIYRGCDFTGADLRQISPGYGRFEACVFDSARIAGWFAFCAAEAEHHR